VSGEITIGKAVDISGTLFDLEKKRCENSLSYFIRAAWHVVEPGQEYLHNWHIDYIAEHLTAITDGHVLEDGTPYNRLLINVPPGAMKSMILNIFWPAWEWGPCNMPHMRYLCAAHQQGLAIRDSTKMRRLVMSDWYQQYWGDRVKLTGDQNAKTKFENTATGFREAMAAGSITGSRGDRVICLPYEAVVLSSEGWLPIGRIVEGRLPVKIAGLSDAGLPEWQSIEAYETNPAGDLVEINIGTSILECTSDHRIFVEERGWVAACEVNPGDIVRTANIWKLRKLFGHHDQKKEVLQQQLLLDVQNKDSEKRQQFAMRDVWGAGLSPPGSPQTKQIWPVLLEYLCGKIKNRKLESSMDWRGCKLNVSALPEYIYSQTKRGKAGKVVLPDMRKPFCMGRVWEAVAIDRLRQLFSPVQTYFKIYANLFKGLRRYIARFPDAGFWKWPVYSWSGCTTLPVGMVKNIPCQNSGAGWQSVQELWACAFSRESNPSRSPHKLQKGRLSPIEPDNGLPVLPRENAREASAEIRVGTAAVVSVNRSSRLVDKTYNLRVAPHHNYFANGVLVHNCDDPHSVEGASSDAMRATTLEWFTEAVPSRLNNPRTSAIVVIMQRLHEEDVSGIILDRKGFKGVYDHICLPMRFETWRAGIQTKLGFEDPRTVEGELLFPARFPKAVVDRDEAAMGPYATAGQMQQAPTPRGGGIIKDSWWQLWDHSAFPPLDYIVASLDTAYSSKAEAKGDFSAMTVWGVWSGDPHNATTRSMDRYGRPYEGSINSTFAPELDAVPRVMLMYAWAERLELHELVQKVAKDCKDLKVDKVLIENKAAGHSVAQEIRRLFAHEKFAVQMYDPKSIDKLGRLYSVQHLFAEGMVFAPNRDYAEQVIRQVSTFPRAKHDDLVDTVSMGLRHLRDMGLLTRSPERLAEINEYKTEYGAGPAPLYAV